MRRARVVAITVGLLATVAVPPARSATIDNLRSGWWTAGAAPSVPSSVSHPTVPAGGLDVAENFTGPYSVAAVHIPEPGSAQDATLTLTLAKAATPGAAVVACPTTSRWTPASGGRLADAPHWDCSRSAPGIIAADGTTIAWKIPAAFARQGAIDVALVPAAGAGPFDAPLSEVKPASVTFSTGSPASEPAAVPPAAGAPTGPPGSEGASAPAPTDNSALPSAGSVAAPDAQPSGPAQTPAAPAAGAPPTGAPPAGAAPATPRPRPERAAIRLGFSLALAVLLGAAVVALARAARSTNPSPAEVRGVGRFATTHTGPPRPL